MFVIVHFLVSTDIIPPEQSPEKVELYPDGFVWVTLYIPICNFTAVPDVQCVIENITDKDWSYVDGNYNHNHNDKNNGSSSFDTKVINALVTFEKGNSLKVRFTIGLSCDSDNDNSDNLAYRHGLHFCEAHIYKEFEPMEHICAVNFKIKIKYSSKWLEWTPVHNWIIPI